MALAGTAHTLFVVVLALVLAERALEFALDRRNKRWLRERGATFHHDDGFKLILLAQVVLFGGLAVEAFVAPWAAVGIWTWPLLAAAALAQALRYWVIRTLGRRWSMRVVTLPGRERILRGPYRWLRHPNYVAVMVEALVLPLAFGCVATAAIAGTLQAVALARRIRQEDTALTAAATAGNEEHGRNGPADEADAA